MPHATTCPHPACSRPVPGMIWACPEHWQALPPRIRQAIWWARREDNAVALAGAAQTAFACWRVRSDAAYAEQPRAA